MLKKDSITFLRFLKFLILKKDTITALFLIPKKDSITSLRLLKVLMLKNDTNTLMILKVFRNSYSVECWWTAAREGRLSYHILIDELDLL